MINSFTMKISIFFCPLFFFLLAFAAGAPAHADDQPARASANKSSSEHGLKHHHGSANTHMNKRSFAELLSHFESESRAEWQKPEEVIKKLGDISGKTVIDIGSGSGYFSFRLAAKGAYVIAADVDQRFLDYVEKKRTERGIDPKRLELRKVPYDSPSLKDSEVDAVLIVNTYHHIEDRIEYFKQVRNGLKSDGKLYVVDYKTIDTPVGPPQSVRIEYKTVEAELRKAGFSGISTDSTLLPYQYIVEAGP